MRVEVTDYFGPLINYDLFNYVVDGLYCKNKKIAFLFFVIQIEGNIRNYSERFFKLNSNFA